VSGLKDEKLILQSKPARQLKHTNSVLEYFEYFCPVSSKLIGIILSYTVSKLVRFFETQCISAIYAFLFVQFFLAFVDALVLVPRNFSQQSVCVVEFYFCFNCQQ